MIEVIDPGRSAIRGTRYSSSVSLTTSPSTIRISSNSALPIPCIVAPSSWRSTSWGLIALPTSATVAVRSTVITPVSGSTATSAPATQTSQKCGPSA